MTAVLGDARALAVLGDARALAVLGDARARQETRVVRFSALGFAAGE